MKIYVAKTLIEGYNHNECHVKLFTDPEKVKNYATQQIEVYADTNGGTASKTLGGNYVMNSSSMRVTIKIEEHEV